MKEDAIKLFYSYSHADEKYRKALETHLAILRRNKQLTDWHDRKIKPGSEWGTDIDSNLSKAEIILLLISPDFIASDYCYSVEMENAMKQHESQQSTVIPIIIRPTDWKKTPFSKLQALPTDAKPITLWGNEDEAWLDVENGIKKVVASIFKDRESRKSINGAILSAKNFLKEDIDIAFTAYENEKHCTGLSTGLTSLDEFIDGLHKSELIVVAGRPDMCKTDFISNIASNVAIHNSEPVVFISMRLPGKKITRKISCSIGKINSYYLSRGIGEKDDYRRLVNAAGMLAESPPYIDDRPVLSIGEIRNSLAAMKSSKGLGLVIIDTIQNIKEIVSSDSSNKTITHVVNELKVLARDLNTPIILTSRLSSDIEQRINKRPMLKDFADFEILQEYADVILFLYRDELYNTDPAVQGIVEIMVAKNINGPTGQIKTFYTPEFSRFENIVEES